MHCKHFHIVYSPFVSYQSIALDRRLPWAWGLIPGRRSSYLYIQRPQNPQDWPSAALEILKVCNRNWALSLRATSAPSSRHLMLCIFLSSIPIPAYATGLCRSSYCLSKGQEINIRKHLGRYIKKRRHCEICCKRMTFLFSLWFGWKTFYEIKVELQIL